MTPPGPPPVPVLGGGWTLRAATAGGADLDTVHRWMHDPRVARRWAQDWPRERWHAELARHLAGDHCVPCLVRRGEKDVAYLELYWAARDPLAPHLAAQGHDLGFHLAIGEGDHAGRGLGRDLIRRLADGLLAEDPHARRVLCEPEHTNAAMIAACTAAGFHAAATVELPHKTAVIMERLRSR